MCISLPGAVRWGLRVTPALCGPGSSGATHAAEPAAASVSALGHSGGFFHYYLTVGLIFIPVYNAHHSFVVFLNNGIVPERLFWLREDMTIEQICGEGVRRVLG